MLEHVEPITRDTLRSLIQKRADVAVSVYHPTERVAVEPEQNSLHLKNLLRDAMRILDAKGVKKKQATQLLQPMNALLDDDDFWRHQGDGLVLFRTPDFFRYYRLPFEVDEAVIVSDELYTKPMLSALAAQGHYYILAASQKSLRLFRATRFGIEQTDVAGTGIPTSLAEALKYDDFQKPELQHHPAGAPGRAEGGPGGPSRPPQGRAATRKSAYHGHGDSGDDQKTEILRYFQAVDDGLSTILRAEHAPLVFVAVDYLHPIFRQATSYRHLLDHGLETNPDQMSAAELHDRTWPIVEPELKAGLERAAERFRNAQGTGLTSCDLAEVLVSSASSRIDSLLLRQGDSRWGRFDPTADVLDIHEEAADDDKDLLYVAARNTIVNGGSVYLLDAEDMPCDEPVAAVYRF
jgi:hypothetical protein